MALPNTLYIGEVPDSVKFDLSRLLKEEEDYFNYISNSCLVDSFITPSSKINIFFEIEKEINVERVALNRVVCHFRYNLGDDIYDRDAIVYELIEGDWLIIRKSFNAF